MEQKKHAIRNSLITIVIVVLVLAVPFVRFGWIDIAPNATSSITVRNGLSGHQFEITETDEIESIVRQVNTINPWIGLRGGAPGYIYLLVFRASDGSEVDRITLVNENTVVMDDFTSSTNVSDILDYLSILETGTSKNPALNLETVRDEIRAGNYPGCIGMAIDDQAMQLVVTIDTKIPNASESIDLLTKKYGTLIRIVEGSNTLTSE